jgi:hypothetical protein
MAATIATPLERALGAIAGVNEITSSSSLGNTRVTLQFDLNRDIDGAARDVQAAINAARTLLPSGLPSNPSYRKVNPADAPIMILSLTSDSLSRGQMYDAASTVLAQSLAPVPCPRYALRSTPTGWPPTVFRWKTFAWPSQPPTPTAPRACWMMAAAPGKSPPTTRPARPKTTHR